MYALDSGIPCKSSQERVPCKNISEHQGPGPSKVPRRTLTFLLLHTPVSCPYFAILNCFPVCHLSEFCDYLLLCLDQPLSKLCLRVPKENNLDSPIAKHVCHDRATLVSAPAPCSARPNDSRCFKGYFPDV